MKERQQKIEQATPPKVHSAVENEIVIVIRNGRVIKFIQRMITSGQEGLYGDGI